MCHRVPAGLRLISAPFSVMKMRNLLLGVILGLLAVVHSTPVNTVTQNPAKPDEADAFVKDAMTEGFIFGPPPTLTTESPKINTTIQASQQPVSNSEDMTEGSAAGETKDMSTTSILPYATTPLINSRAQIFASTESHMFEGSALGETDNETTTPFALDTTTTTLSVTHAPTSDFTESYVFEGSAVETTTPFALNTTASLSVTHAPTSDFTESDKLEESGSGEPVSFLYTTTTSVPNEVWSSITSNYNVVSQPTDPAVSTSDFLSILGSSSGSEGMIEPDTVSTITSHLSSSKHGENMRGRLGAGFNNELQAQTQTQTQKTESEQKHNGHVTPDWLIILGFIVGVAALVILCVAIATRHKWNQANQANLTVATSNSSNQQREQEMEIFLPSDKPKENGNSAEYTVIPLEDLPENYPSQ